MIGSDDLKRPELFLKRVGGLTEKRRFLMLKVLDGFPNGNAIVALSIFDRYRRCDEALQWLIKNKLTGRRFCEFMQYEHGWKALFALKDIMRRVYNESEERPIIGGKDFRR